METTYKALATLTLKINNNNTKLKSCAIYKFLFYTFLNIALMIQFMDQVAE